MFCFPLIALVFANFSEKPHPVLSPGGNWKLDVLVTQNGAKYQGIVLDESSAGVRFRVVRRPPGRATVTLTTYFQKNEVDQIIKITDAERQTIKAKLAELDPTGAGERQRMEDLELKPTDWLGEPNRAKKYVSEQFILKSSASDEITRRAAVRLEQIFTAYARFLPPRVQPKTDRALTILLAPDKAEYQRLLNHVSEPVLNPALFDAERNQIICGSDLRRLGQDLAAARIHNVQQLAQLDRYEADIRKLYKDSRLERERHLSISSAQRKKIWAVEAANESKFNETTARLFSLLYHETFHAYVTNFVYPPLDRTSVEAGKGVGELPHWLNEGLAQIFETPILDGGELRVGHADRERLARAKELVEKKQFLPVSELARTSGQAFKVLHSIQKSSADRIYLTAWATTFHIVFEKRLLGTKKWDQYLITVNSGGDPVTALENLLGMPLETYDQQLATYISRLRPDGSLFPKK